MKDDLGAPTEVGRALLAPQAPLPEPVPVSAFGDDPLAREIVGDLTKAQRRIIADFPMRKTSSGELGFVDYQVAGIRQRRTRAKLTNSGITECYQSGPMTIFSMVRLSELGLTVRHLLNETNND